MVKYKTLVNYLEQLRKESPEMEFIFYVSTPECAVKVVGRLVMVGENFVHVETKEKEGKIINLDYLILVDP